MTLQQLKDNFELCMAKTKDFVDQFPWESSEAYAQWLSQSYFFVSHSTRLLALSAAHATFTQGNLHKRMLEHVAEEIGHEMIAANDLKQMGRNIKDFSEMRETQAFYRNQYFHIQNHGSEAFVGYVLFLEGLACTKGFDIMKRISAAHGEKACNFVRVHAELDQDHLKSAFELVDGLDPSSFALISSSMMESCFFYERMLEDIMFSVLPKYAKLPKAELPTMSLY